MPVRKQPLRKKISQNKKSSKKKTSAKKRVSNKKKNKQNKQTRSSKKYNKKNTSAKKRVSDKKNKKNKKKKSKRKLKQKSKGSVRFNLQKRCGKHLPIRTIGNKISLREHISKYSDSWDIEPPKTHHQICQDINDTHYITPINKAKHLKDCTRICPKNTYLGYSPKKTNSAGDVQESYWCCYDNPLDDNVKNIKVNYKKDLDEDIDMFNQQRKKRDEEELRKRHTVETINTAKEDPGFDDLFPVAGDGEW
jgi:hypothetical protein